eukprot:6201393-Amphidinium_carterae.1
MVASSWLSTRSLALDLLLPLAFVCACQSVGLCTLCMYAKHARLFALHDVSLLCACGSPGIPPNTPKL